MPAVLQAEAGAEEAADRHSEEQQIILIFGVIPLSLQDKTMPDHNDAMLCFLYSRTAMSTQVLTFRLSSSRKQLKQTAAGISIWSEQHYLMYEQQALAVDGERASRATATSIKRQQLDFRNILGCEELWQQESFSCSNAIISLRFGPVIQYPNQLATLLTAKGLQGLRTRLQFRSEENQSLLRKLEAGKMLLTLYQVFDTPHHTCFQQQKHIIT